MKKFLVQRKDYKTDVGFNKLQTGKNDSLVIGSNNGELRFFQDSNKIAKNLIPSFQGDKVEFLDSTNDNSFLLLTFPTYLILLSTDINE